MAVSLLVLFFVGFMAYTYSFIIPHRNAPSLLKRCVESIPEREDVEVIVVDDHSDEDKVPDLPERDHLRLLRLDPTEPGGAGQARNRGLAVARGKWILFADCDDYYAPGAIAVLDKYRESELDLLYFNFEYRDGESFEPLQSMPIASYLSKDECTERDWAEIRFHHKMPWTKMARKSFLDQYAVRFENSINGNDIFYSLQVGYYARLVALEPTPLYVYLKNPGSLVNRAKSVASAYCHLLHKMQLNHFYRFMGHPEWCLPAWKEFLCKCRLLGPSFLCYVLRRLPAILRGRTQWVRYFRGE